MGRTTAIPIGPRARNASGRKRLTVVGSGLPPHDAPPGDPPFHTPLGAKLAGAIALSLWTCVVASGRMVAFVWRYMKCRTLTGMGGKRGSQPVSPEPLRLYRSPSFWVKMGLTVLLGVQALRFRHRGLRERKGARRWIDTPGQGGRRPLADPLGWTDR